jgi:hypothetical protein
VNVGIGFHGLAEWVVIGGKEGVYV